MLQASTIRPSNSRRNYAGPSVARLSSALPDDARAVIERETRSVTQSAPARRRGWRLRFDRRAPQGVDPLTGWTTGADPLAHVTLRFPDLASAIRYAERHDLPYEVREEAQAKRGFGGRQAFEGQAPIQLCCWPSGPHALCCGNYPFSFGGLSASDTDLFEQPVRTARDDRSPGAEAKEIRT
jgi:hypothetical protein